MRILVTGATGLIGSRLVRSLLQRGDTVMPLSRQALPPAKLGEEFASRCEPLQGNPQEAGDWLQAIATVDAVVHLAGEPIMAQRWSQAFLQKVRESRVRSTQLIAQAFAQAPRRNDGVQRIFISGSAIGYYGANTGDAVLNEGAPAGSDPMAEISRAWEEAAAPARDAGVRTCLVRTGIVLDPNEGALPRLILPFRLYAGGRVGSGKQYMSWIHRDDMNSALLFALDRADFQGPLNATAPNPVRNREFAATIARVLRKPNWLPVPTFALRIALGKVVQVVAGGQNAIPQKLQQHGFSFRFAELEPALRDLLNAP